GGIIGVFQELLDPIPRRRSYGGSITPPLIRDIAVDLIDGARELNRPGVLCRSRFLRYNHRFGQRSDDLRNKDLYRLLPQLSVRIEIERIRIYRDLDGGYALGPGHFARLSIKTGIDHRHGGDSELLGQDCRVTRTRCADPSTTVAADDGIDVLGFVSRY